MNIMRPSEEDSILWLDLCGWQLTEYHALEMVYTRQKEIAGDNTEYPPITQHKINIRGGKNSQSDSLHTGTE